MSKETRLSLPLHLNSKPVLLRKSFIPVGAGLVTSASLRAVFGGVNLKPVRRYRENDCGRPQTPFWPKMSRILPFVISLIIGIAAFVIIQELLHVQSWIAAIIAGAALIFTFLSAVFEFLKKPLELQKLWRENEKLKRENKRFEEEKNRRIHEPTPAEVEKYSAPYIERIVTQRYRREERLDRVSVRRFIVESHEERREQ
jgi:hypothetical protein